MADVDNVALRVESLTKSFGPARVLHDVSFKVLRGEFVILLGPSGAGKTTLFRILAALTAADGGTFSDFLPGDVGLIFQQFNLVRRASALENVLVGRVATLPGWRALVRRFSANDRQRALAALDEVGLLSFASRRADRLSGGQQQRVAIARVLAQGARVLFADEPIASLDPASARAILQTLRDVAHRDKIAVVCSLHQADLAVEYADRLIGLKDGRIAFDTTPDRFGAREREELYAAIGASAFV